MGTCDMTSCCKNNSHDKLELHRQKRSVVPCSIYKTDETHKNVARYSQCSIEQNKREIKLKHFTIQQHPYTEVLDNLRQTAEVNQLSASSPKVVKINKSEQNIDNYEILSELGHGNFSHVYLAMRKNCKSQNQQSMYAIKVIKKEQTQDKEVQTSMNLERLILSQSKSYFVNKLHFAFSDEKYFYLVMDWASGGDSISLFQKNSKRQLLFKKAGERASRFLLGCIILGLQYLHNLNILFVDLKSQNVLLFPDGYAKLTDFGLSKKIKPGQRIEVHSGSLPYIAPEIIRGQKCGLELDFWALGIMAYQMSNFTVPFSPQIIKNKKLFSKAIKKFHRQKTWQNQNASQNMKDLVYGLLTKDQSKRLGANGWKQIKDHPFFRDENFNWDKLASKNIKSPLFEMIAEKIEPREMRKKISSSFQEQNSDAFSDSSL